VVFLPTFRDNLSVPSSRTLEDGTDWVSADIGKKLPLLFLDFLSLNMEPICCAETSIRNCHYTVRNYQAQRPHQHCSGSLKSRLAKFKNRKNESYFCDFLFHTDTQTKRWSAYGEGYSSFLLADLSPRRPVFNFRLFHVGFMVYEVTLEQVYLRVVWFALVRIIPSTLHTHISFTYQRSCIILAIDTVLNKA
jgi:hypothetical protein